ncbi:hypothetical protein DPMN_161648 [Dreissena polymorpha]|uniref:Uncharacterized protein n=1 Tax=Dreissena polymorpha TaxID=45954 RepID=A0A9D4ETE9_DREPO|nr:hypothetical protein DPMN_161648 [Dreissena polymorpha]
MNFAHTPSTPWDFWGEGDVRQSPMAWRSFLPRSNTSLQLDVCTERVKERVLWVHRTVWNVNVTGVYTLILCRVHDVKMRCLRAVSLS